MPEAEHFISERNDGLARIVRTAMDLGAHHGLQGRADHLTILRDYTCKTTHVINYVSLSGNYKESKIHLTSPFLLPRRWLYRTSNW